ncbi:MAG: aspartyl protease, partial [Phormidesmis priestleyi]
VLIDTGATTLCLPAKVIEKLGLELLREVDVATANGFSKARVFQDAKISLCGREGTFECLELPGGQSPLLGVIPLEFLGIESDLRNQTLKVLPDHSANTYLTIL